MTNQIINEAEARLLKPYLKYMNFGDLRKDRHFLVERAMYQNLMLENVSRSLIKDLRENFVKANPGVEIPEILRKH